MNSDPLERVAAVAQSIFMVNPAPTAELQMTLAFAVSSGEPLAVITAAADVPAFAVLYVVDTMYASQSGRTDSAVSADRFAVSRGDGMHYGRRPALTGPRAD